MQPALRNKRQVDVFQHTGSNEGHPGDIEVGGNHLPAEFFQIALAQSEIIIHKTR